MVKRKNVSISEDDGESGLINENGKVIFEDKEKKKRIKTKSLYRQPTVNELNRLQETETLFNSNLFRLQVEEILQEVKVKEKVEKRFLQWFTDFKNHLDSIPTDDTEYDLTEHTLTKKIKVKLPISEELKKTKCVFKFHKFETVDIVGSYALGCAINSKLVVDLQITVPSQTYTKNDSINYRYHKKRAAYLAYIASYLSKSDIIVDLNYSFINGCETKPILILKPAGKLQNHLSVRINLVCDTDTFKLHRFSPKRNNLRQSWLFSTTESEETDSPTPYYNSSILYDVTALNNEKLLRDTLLNSENLKQAVVLLKIWLRQRNIPISGQIVNNIVVYYVQTKRVNNIMSSYQIVRNIWIALKTSEWDKKGISLCKAADATPSLEEFHQNFPIVFIDSTGYYNICWQICKGTYYALKRECALAVEMLDNVKINSFIPLFMTPVKMLMKFDHILRFKNMELLKTSVLDKVSKDDKLNYGLDRLMLVTDTVYSLLAKGLGDRVHLILQMVEADFTWPVKKVLSAAKTDSCYEEKLAFGLILNKDNALNPVEKGPPANLPEALEFRAFWGDKSELRRFQDGSITETCVWEGEATAERRGITKQIINYLMDLKYGVKGSDLFHVMDQLDSVLVRKQYAGESSAHCEEACLDVLRAFDELRRDLRQLTELPLDISAVYGTSSVFSYSRPVPPVARPAPRQPYRRAGACLLKQASRRDGLPSLPHYTPVSRAVIELGHSGKWPGDIEAFRCLKAAFHLQISDRLTEQYSLITHAYPSHVDVLKNGLVFRLAIAHPKEITLLKREIENGVVKHKDSEESARLQRDTQLMPRLRGALHGLHQKYPAFGPTACLFKRWLSSHLLSPPHFPSVTAELMAATVFLHPQPFTPPTQPTIGLFRVLRLLAATDWTSEVFVLDFNDDLTREQITELEQAARADPRGRSVCIVTAQEREVGLACEPGPPPPALRRAQALAASALAYLENSLLNEFNDNLLPMFVPSLSEYDVQIVLHPSLVPEWAERVCAPPRRRPPTPHVGDELIPVVDFHPVLTYLDDLRSAYGDFAVFFHDLYGGEVIAVLWKPDVDEYEDFQALNANALIPETVDGETRYKVNKEAIIEDFRILGQGLVKSVNVL
ncbi:nucleolar protein 6 [Bombyx mori]|uniref:Nucleolar protein 6 n=1 Tax=Bombyx mori TaxID=7091 RepID=A0A8R1WIN3_BOMMO|nr:nucleolar protein 6 [Bombyx mori]